VRRNSRVVALLMLGPSRPIAVRKGRAREGLAPTTVVALAPTQFGSICRSLERRKRAKLQRSDRSGCAALAPSLKSMEDPGGDVAIRFAVMIGSWRIESRPVELASRQPQS
jgi:hypothetical protein